MPRNFSHYYKVIEVMKRELELPKTLNIRRIKLKDNYDGICYMWNKRYYIRIDSRLSEDEAVYTLKHELAHVLQRNFWCKYRMADDDKKDAMLEKAHNAEWGINYAKVYSVYERNFT